MPSDQVHLWCIGASQVPVDDLILCLDDDERHRMDRLHSDDKRRQKQASRIALRQVLSAYMGIGEADVRLWYGPLGRPHLDHYAHQTRLNFNVSHSGDLIVIALANTPLLGVDIELHRTLARYDRLLARCYSVRERDFLTSIEDQAVFRSQFYRAWTAKEALLKSTGGSIFHAASSIDLNLDNHLLSLNHAADSTIATHQWQLIEFDPCSSPVNCNGNSYSGSIAIADGNWQMKRLTYPADLSPPAG